MKPVLGLLGVLLSLLACAAEAPAPNRPQELKQTMDLTFLKLHFAKSNEKDAAKVAAYFKDAEQRLNKEFESHGKLLEGVDCDVYLHEESNEYANEATCTLLTNYDEARGKAAIHFLAPSKYDATHLTSAGEPKDEKTFYKYVVHEFSTIYLERLARVKKEGWLRGPAWFTQGYEEYLALTCSSERARTETLAKYIAIVKADPARVDFSFGLEARDPYIDGAVLVAFLHETFGRERVQQVLCSTEATFGAALKKELGVTLESFAEKWTAWLKAK